MREDTSKVVVTLEDAIKKIINLIQYEEFSAEKKAESSAPALEQPEVAAIYKALTAPGVAENPHSFYQACGKQIYSSPLYCLEFHKDMKNIFNKYKADEKIINKLQEIHNNFIIQLNIKIAKYTNMQELSEFLGFALNTDQEVERKKKVYALYLHSDKMRNLPTFNKLAENKIPPDRAMQNIQAAADYALYQNKERDARYRKAFANQDINEIQKIMQERNDRDHLLELLLNDTNCNMILSKLYEKNYWSYQETLAKKPEDYELAELILNSVMKKNDKENFQEVLNHIKENWAADPDNEENLEILLENCKVNNPPFFQDAKTKQTQSAPIATIPSNPSVNSTNFDFGGTKSFANFINSALRTDTQKSVSQKRKPDFFPDQTRVSKKPAVKSEGKLTSQLPDLLVKAIESDDELQLQSAVSQRVKAMLKNDLGYAALNLALSSNKIGAVNYLLQFVNQTDPNIQQLIQNFAPASGFSK